MGVLLAQEQVDRFGVAEFDKREGTHVWSVMRSGGSGYCPARPSPQRLPTMRARARHMDAFTRGIRDRNLLNAEIAAREFVR